MQHKLKIKQTPRNAKQIFEQQAVGGEGYSWLEGMYRGTEGGERGVVSIELTLCGLLPTEGVS